ncbi:MAG: glycosyltransferase family 4 protein [Hyphomicrobiales bacterium]|nr:glycosyltransferase family 4 protein [Hyphomicrobiales bacterium]MBV8826845.1 glycosyltransferase family 4 protein [Hyphomicrobiales bacterium]MBV9428034.1 glycosyltransferase family 4 protein [Bradyrhizobiaceae bacterium]
MVKRLAFAVPGDLDTPTGGYAYDRRIIDELRKLGWNVDVIDLGNEFPRPSSQARSAAIKTLLAIPHGMPLVIDGLAFGVMSFDARRLALRRKLVALVHHPLALEPGLTRAEAATFQMLERTALSAPGRVVTTSQMTARVLMSHYRVPERRLIVAPPGNDKAPAARGSGGNGPLALLSVGALVPRKGYDVLIAALATLRELPWRLTIAGDRTRDPATAHSLEADIARFGLVQRVTVAGAVSDDRLDALYDGADLFVLPSRYEGYGMAFAAALARGLPVIGSDAGAIPEAVPPDAGILVPPDNVPALAAALYRLITDPRERGRLAVAARAAAAQLPTWTESAVLFSRALEKAR